MTQTKPCPAIQQLGRQMFARYMENYDGPEYVEIGEWAEVEYARLPDDDWFEAVEIARDLFNRPMR